MRRPQPKAAGRKPRPGTAASRASAHVRRGGRPSRTEALQIAARILDVATALFFTGGYGATTIEAVATRARISKRTFYHRYADKPALFSAVVHRTIEGLRPAPDVLLVEGEDLQQVLQRLARVILRAAMSAPAIALHRLIVAESARFPKLAAIVTEQGGAEEAIALIAGILDREARAGRVALDAPVFAARQFLHMVISWPQRRALGLGKPMTAAELDAWADDAVNLFLNGCRGWIPSR